MLSLNFFFSKFTVEPRSSLACSLRHDRGECAGARLQSLVFRKYVLQLRWRVQVRPDGSAAVDNQRQLSEADAEEESFQAALAHLQSLANCLEVTAVPTRWTPLL